ncbi:kinase-like protein [Rhizophagus irregularis]|nr:kinase-like protein [Rhizophagus irregularis]
MAYSRKFYDPKLKSNPVPILFIPFKKNEEKCNYCGIEYSKTLEFEQKYCKNCLFWYIKYMGNLKTYISTNNTQCIEHKATRNGFFTTNIQEWCEYCSEISFFTHLIPNTSSLNNYSSLSDARGYCYPRSFERNTYKLIECGQEHHFEISSEWVESILNKKSIQILYLSWWDNFDKCVVCLQELKYIHQESVPYYQKWCQKWCSNCFIIYTGCRYCLTTNVIFGITSQSQCKNCERISFINIDITNVSCENCIMDEFILTITRNFTDSNSLRFIRHLFSKMVKYLIERIPYSQFKDLRKIGEGGFSIIYKATWSDGTRNIDVALKKLFNSHNISKHFFNELKALSRCNYESLRVRIIGFHGITQDPITEEYILVMEYANSGNLHNYLQKNFINITWTEKLRILKDISSGLKYIHANNFMHRDFHSGNMLLSNTYWKVGDLGLSQPANNTLSNNEIYGVIPYIAPEIFNGAAFSKESDVYSLGMIMWELTTGCKPFANVEHNFSLIYEIIDGKRPEITSDTPECFANLMKKCWDSEPSKRPTTDEIKVIFEEWSSIIYKTKFFEQAVKKRLESKLTQEALEQAEKKRLELIQLKKLGPEFSEKPHPNAIYTSRALSSLIFKSSTIDFSSINSVSTIQEYITKEYELDINKVQSSSTQNINSSQVPNLQHQNVSGPLNNLTANSSRKRNNEELNIEIQKSKKIRKNINTDDSNKELY